MRRTLVKTLLMMVCCATLAASWPVDPPLPPHPGTGVFLLVSDVHFNPFADAAMLQTLGAKVKTGCPTSAPNALSKFGTDSNLPLLKSTFANAAKAARDGHFHYDYVIVTGDFLAHNFVDHYRQCVEGGDAEYSKFSADSIRYVEEMITKALPGVPVFAALGNNDSDQGDYAEPSAAFLASVGAVWGQAWGRPPAAALANGLASFTRNGYYLLPDPAVPRHEFIVLNTNLWSDHHGDACSESNFDPGSQFVWLEKVLDEARQSATTATLVMHIPPGMDALRSSAGEPRSLWTDRCTDRMIEKLTKFRGVVRQLYAGHLHRDDFRIFPDHDGKPLAAVHISPSVSPVYFNNPAVEVGWYDRTNGDLRDYAPLFLNLDAPQPIWKTEYIFSQAYARPRADLAALEDLSQVLLRGNPTSGVGALYAKYYTAGVGLFLTPDNWSNYACAQTAITSTDFALCRHAAVRRPQSTQRLP